MQGLKDSLNDHKKTVTLSAQQINFLMFMNSFMQAELDKMQERMAGAYLSNLAVTEFGCDPNKDFHFDFHPELESDNLTITEGLEKK